MLKKIIKMSALCVAAAAVLSSCGSGIALPDFDPDKSDVKVTLEELKEANSLDSILSRHENCYATVELRGEPYTGFGVYQTNDVFFYEFYNPAPDTWQATVYSDGEQWFMRYGEDALPVLAYNWYAMSDEEKYNNHFLPGRHEFFQDPALNEQVIINTEITEGGKPRIYTRSPDRYAEEIREKFGLNNTRYWFSKLDHRYSLYPDSPELEYNKNYIQLQSGMVYTFYHSLLQYDVNEPDFMKMVLAIANSTRNDDSAEMKALTAVYDAGTADEQTYTMQYNGRYAVTLFGRDGYSPFTDPEGQVPFDGNIPYDDLTVYFLKK